MKCIKAKGKILRVPDFQAKALVESGAAVYVAKSDWKRSKKDTSDVLKIAPRPATRDEIA